MSGPSASADPESAFAEGRIFLGRFVRAVIGMPADVADVDDIVSDCMLIAWTKRTDFLAADDPESWLRAVARRVLANYWRKRHTRVALTTLPGADMPDPSDETELADDVLTVLDAASTLTRTDKEILILSAVDGLSPAEIGTRLGISAGAARSRLMRARRHLRDAL